MEFYKDRKVVECILTIMKSVIELLFLKGKGLRF